MDSNAIIVRDSNTPLSSVDESSRQKWNKETLDLNDTLVQMDLTNLYRTLHPKATEYTFFSSAYGTSSMIGYVLGHKTSLANLRILKS